MEGVSIMRTILAVGHPQIHQALKSFPELEIVGEIFERQDLLISCQQDMPELVIASEMLRGKELGDLIPFLIGIKQSNPFVRIIYLAGQLDETNRDHRLKVQNLVNHQIYDLYMQKELSLRNLRELILYPQTIEALKTWLVLESPIAKECRMRHSEIEPSLDEGGDSNHLMAFSKRKQLSQATNSNPSFVEPNRHSSFWEEELLDAKNHLTNRDRFPKIQWPQLNWRFPSFNGSFSLPKIQCPQLKWQIPSINWSRSKHTFISLGLVSVGVFCLYTGFKPLWTLKTGTAASVLEWEKAKETFLESGRDRLEIDYYQDSIQEVVADKQNATSSSASQTTDIFGLLQLAEGEKRLGLRSGTSDEILDKGAGFEPKMATPGEQGNAVIFGHREEVFWKLKDLKAGDLIRLETLEGELAFKVTRTFVTKPDSEEIYQDSDTSIITLVTCYPFVYMGPTPERFVVVAERVN